MLFVNPIRTNITGKIKTAEIMKRLGKGIGLSSGDSDGDGKADRLPPGQRLLNNVDEFPVLDLGFVPEFDPAAYRFQVAGLVENPLDLSWEEFKDKFPKSFLTADFHCVTKWSKYDVKWGGIKYLDIEKVVKPKAAAKVVLQYGLDDYTTNVPIEDLRSDNVLLAYELEGQPLPPEHGGPLRLIIPKLYGWKGSKFLYRLEFLDHDQPGFWEVRGYHNHGDSWKEERYG